MSAPDPAQPSSAAERLRLPLRRPVTIAMLFVTLLVFGWRSYQELPLNLMPDISYPTLTVRTEYADAAPEDVEKLVTRPLEERLSIVTGVVEISSISSAGLSEVILEFTWGTDMNVALQDVRESLDLFDPPDGVTKRPVILRYDPTLDPVMRVALASDEPASTRDEERRRLTEIRRAAEEYIKSDLEAEPGIAQVLVKGGREEEIQVVVDARRLKEMGLTVADVVRSVEAQNINLSGGRLKEGSTEFLVRTLNEYEDIAEIGDTVIQRFEGDQILFGRMTDGAGSSGSVRRLRDVATVEMGEKDRETVVRINGREAIQLEFYKEGDANIVQVCETLKDFFNFERKVSVGERLVRFMGTWFPSERTRQAVERLERRDEMRDQLRNRLPRYAEPYLVSDQSRFIVASIREVQNTALIGGLLALAILYVFLRQIRSTIMIGLAIPISVVSTFVPMFIGDVSLNIMSLGGLALGIGMLVDNSVVVIESIYRCGEEGDDRLQAANRGTGEVSGAVIASTFTTVAVFFPMVFVEGIAGQLFRDLALTVTFSLVASLLVALLLIPMMASRARLELHESRRAVWVLRAFADRRAQGASAAAAAAGVPATGLRYAREGLAASYRETLGLVLARTRSAVEIEGRTVRHGFVMRVLWAVLIPFAAVLFVLQAALKLLAAALTTVLFVALGSTLGAAWLVGRMAKAVLAAPMFLFDRTFTSVRAAYGRGLRLLLPFSPAVLVLVALVTAHSARTASDLGQELIPALKQGEFGIRIESQPGTRLEDTEALAVRIADVVRRHPLVASVMIEAGASAASTQQAEGEHVANLTVHLTQPEVNAARQDEIIDTIRRDVLAVTSETVKFTLPALFSFRDAVELRIQGEDLETLRALGEDALARIAAIRGIKDTELSLKQGYPEVHIRLDRQLLAAMDLPPAVVAEALRTEVQGDVATRLTRGAERIDIRVQTNDANRPNLQDLSAISVTDGSTPTPLSAVAEIVTAEGPSEIRRVDQQRVALITANIAGRDLLGVSLEIEDRMREIAWPEGYSFSLGGQNRELETSYGSLTFALALAVFLVYVVMACQFESIRHPALIMFSVPLAFVGVVYVLDLFAIPLSVVVFIGGIVLAGIVVNNAIVLVDYINQLRARGRAKADAVVEAGQVRFRPIMITTSTTVLGLIPMAVSSGEGAEIRGPMAITVMAGLVSATVLTLFIIPMLYYLFGGRDPRPADPEA